MSRTPVHRLSTETDCACLAAPPDGQKPSSETQTAHAVTETTPPTYALRCTDHRHPVYADSKVTRNKKPQVRGLTWGSPWSRLRDSKPRPTHYEGSRGRDGWCHTIALDPVSPDQRLAGCSVSATESTWCRTVRSRIAHAGRGADQRRRRPQTSIALRVVTPPESVAAHLAVQRVGHGCVP